MRETRYDIVISNETGRRAYVKRMRAALESLLTSYNVPSCRIDVLVTTNSRMADLNSEFRKENCSTDVLTFPGPGWEGAPMGDIAVSLDYAESGARERGVAVSTELAFLAVHGGLHLLGFDDVDEPSRLDMVKRMNTVMVSCGLPPDDAWTSQPHEGDQQ